MTALRSLLCVKLANHGNKSMVNSQIGYWLLYFSDKVALTCTFNFNICLDSQKQLATEFDLSLIILTELELALHKAYRSSNKGSNSIYMPFEARKTNFTVFSLNHELYHLTC